MDKGLTFQDPIPNNLATRRPGSRVSLDNEFVVKSIDGSINEEIAPIGGQDLKVSRDLPDNTILSARFGNSTFRSPVDASYISPPKGLKNSGIFNYQTGKFELSIGLAKGPRGSLGDSQNRTLHSQLSKSEVYQGPQKQSKSVMMNMETTLSSADRRSKNHDPSKRIHEHNRTFTGPFGHKASAASHRQHFTSGMGALLDHDSSTAVKKSKGIEHLNGSFLQFDMNNKRLVDMSRQVLSSPRKHVIGENAPSHNFSSQMRVPWANPNVKSNQNSQTATSRSGGLNKGPSSTIGSAAVF